MIPAIVGLVGSLNAASGSAPTSAPTITAFVDTSTSSSTGDVTFTAVTGATYYEIWSSGTSATTGFTLIVTPPIAGTERLDLVAYTTNWVKVRAVNSFGAGPFSAVASAGISGP
jgi:hypothetical protein